MVDIAQLIEALPVGVFILDAAGTAVYANAAAQQLLGRGVVEGARADNLGEHYPAYVAGTDQPYPTHRMPIVRALGGEQSTVDDMEVDRRGERVALEVMATPIFDREQRIAFAVAVFQDITERRRASDHLESEVERRTEELARAKAAAEQANKAKSLFLMHVSHELRTPLHHVIGFSELLASRIEDPKSRSLAETAGTSGRELLGKLDDLIELARAETETSGRLEMTFDFDALIADIAAGARLRCELPQRVGTVRGDLAVFRRVLAELLERAAEEHAVVLSVHTDANRVVVSIPSERLCARVRALAFLFGESVTVDGSRFQQTEIDFRLAIARARARTLGGDIVAAEGLGVVEVQLPIA